MDGVFDMVSGSNRVLSRNKTTRSVEKVKLLMQKAAKKAPEGE